MNQNVTDKSYTLSSESSSSTLLDADQRYHNIEDEDERPKSLPCQQIKSQPPSSLSHMTRSSFLALLAVCTMSIGSHFAMYLLGPLKSRLHREMGTSNSQFSLLVAAFNLNSTWTPLVAGLLVSRFGTNLSSVVTTGSILLGQIILLIGVLTSHITVMTAGLFVFGLGLSPLSVVQETLVSRLSPSGHMGISLALGLVSGKSSAFISSVVSLPLANRFGDGFTFGLAALLCALGFVGNGMRLAFGWGKEVGEGAVSEKRKVTWGGVGALGDVFWLYLLFNVFSGAIWQPFLHLAANLVQHRYAIPESLAAVQASILGSGAIILYPIVGFLTDRIDPSTPRTTFLCIIISSTLTLLAYTYLSLPPTLTHTAWLGMVLFAFGHGMITLLMVILVPRIVPLHLVPLGLGLHKSMEMASTTTSQTLSGLWLDSARNVEGDAAAGTGLLRIYWITNALQLGCAVLLWRLEERRRARPDDVFDLSKAEEYEVLPMTTLEDDVLDEREDHQKPPPEVSLPIASGPTSALAKSDRERRRGRYFFMSTLGWIGIAWVVFLGTAWVRL